jgi:hypothetical protein
MTCRDVVAGTGYWAATLPTFTDGDGGRLPSRGDGNLKEPRQTRAVGLRRLIKLGIPSDSLKEYKNGGEEPRSLGQECRAPVPSP